MRKLLISFFVLMTLNGCASLAMLKLLDAPANVMFKVLTPTEEEQNMNFQKKLKAGWRYYIIDNKLILVKDTPSGLLVSDPFRVLEK